MGRDEAMIVALGPGSPEALPLAAVRALTAAAAVDLGAPGALRSAVEALGVRHREGAPVVARADGEAWRLAEASPGTPTLPDRDALEERGAAAALVALFRVTLRLRRDCPWDRAQTAASIVPHTLEEAYEVAEKALAGPPDAALVDELGDLLFQTYFLAALTREVGAGDLQAVAEGIAAKLVRRHPHVYGPGSEVAPGVIAPARSDAGGTAPGARPDGAATAGPDTADAVRSRWDAIKREQEGREGIFHDVPASLPGLLHARKVQRRAAAVGFDWARWEDAWPSVVDELRELRDELEATRETLGREVEPPARVREEAGDLLFAAVNVLRLAGVDPELAVRGASARFRARVESAERLAAADGHDFAVLGLDAQDEYYRAAKRGPATAPAPPEPIATPPAPREPSDTVGQETTA